VEVAELTPVTTAFCRSAGWSIFDREMFVTSLTTFASNSVQVILSTSHSMRHEAVDPGAQWGGGWADDRGYGEVG
jgi:hypothetical protein